MCVAVLVSVTGERLARAPLRRTEENSRYMKLLEKRVIEW